MKESTLITAPRKCKYFVLGFQHQKKKKKQKKTKKNKNYFSKQKTNKSKKIKNASETYISNTCR